MPSKEDATTTGMVRDLRSQGFAIADTAVDADLLAELSSEADRLIGRFDAGYRSADYWNFDRDEGREQVLYRIHRLEQQGSELIRRLFTAGPWHEVAERAAGRPVRSTVCAMIVKRAGGSAEVPWHRDRTSVPPHTLYNLSIFLDDSDTGNGCLEFVPASHLLADDASVDQVRQAGPVQPVPARAGELLVHDVRMVHGSAPNNSPRRRRSIVVEFAPEGFSLSPEES